MKDSQIKSKIARIIVGAIKSTLKDHPEYLDGKLIKKSAMSSVAKRSAGHILRLLRMHAVTNTASEHADSPFSKALAANLKLMAKREFTHDLEPALGPENLDKRAEIEPGHSFSCGVYKGIKCTCGEEVLQAGRRLPLKELTLHSSLFDDSYEGEAQHKERELVESTRDLMDKAEEHFVDDMVEAMKTDVPEELERRRTLNGKPRC